MMAVDITELIAVALLQTRSVERIPSRRESFVREVGMGLKPSPLSLSKSSELFDCFLISRADVLGTVPGGLK